MRKHDFKRQSGTSMVEFAFVASLFFMLLFGIIEFSVILYDKAVITNASREGARTGILFRVGDRTIGSLAAENTIVENVVTAYASNYLISLGGDSSITTVVTRRDNLVTPNGKFDVGDELIVTVTYPYDFLILPAFAAGLSDFTLGAVTTMRAE
ncbi:MAG: pilus assembly protein [Gammaproteobacteria bacterium]|nr:MAG: pilus assembly protein [Gammaproteobacteria bacterium]RLA51558.1 MAG: pilus assembly protein [Gammaproteobacteria bacterium]